MNFYSVVFCSQSSPDRNSTTANILDMEHATFDSKPYSYICTVDCKVGDFVLVETSYGIKVAKVYKELPSKLNATKFILGVLDIAAFRRCRETYEEERKLLAQLDTAMAKQNREAQYRLAAASNPEIADMVQKLDELRLNRRVVVASKLSE